MGVDSQPTLPFEEGEQDPAHTLQPRVEATAVARRTPKATPVPFLAAFAQAWDAPDAREAMVRACADLRERADQTHPPFAITPMLRVLSAKRITSTATKTHGRLRVGPQGWTIERRTDQPWRRVRFTEAHEIAHILIYEALADDTAMLADLHRPEHHTRLETLCDLGASELLIPGDDFTRNASGTETLLSLAQYMALYDRYLASHQVLLRKFAHEGQPWALSTWSWQEHPRGTAWRIEHAISAPGSGIYLPAGISRRRLSSDVIERALEHATAHANLSLEYSNRRLSGAAYALFPALRREEQLPLHEGHEVGDDAGSRVYLLQTPVHMKTLHTPRWR